MASNIPEESTSFVGRRAELRRIDEELTEHRLITLTGPGGVGKTRIAMRAARAAAARFPDGVCWADLWPLQGAGRLVASVCDAVGLADHTARTPVAVLCEWLADKRLLLVLDSCEHLVDACRDLLGDLLTAAPAVTVLVTSRQPLDIVGEWTTEIGPLPCTGDNDALTLFTQRAGTAAPGVEFAAPPHAAAAAVICRRLEGIPLALELAGAQLAGSSVEQIAERLTSRFDTLDGDRPVRLPRHRTLRCAIGWSHELCAPLERLLWARLSVFRGTFDEESASAVCAGGPLTEQGVRGTLAALAAKSVLTREGTRYRMLDTLREYGRMWLTELDETTALADRHAAHFAAFGRRAELGWLGPEQVGWYGRVAEAHVDLCTALDHLLVTDPERAQELSGSIGFFWSCCGHLHEARDYVARALAAHQAPSPARTRALWALGVAVLLQGDLPLADALGLECSRAARASDDAEAVLQAGYLIGLTHLMAGRPMSAHTVAEQVLGPAPRAPFDSPGRLRCHLVQLFALTALGRLAEARAEATALRRGCVQRGEYWSRSYIDYQLALISLFQGLPEESADHARAMLAAKEGIGDKFGIALGLDLFAAAVAAQGDGAAAARLYGSGQAIWRTVGHPQRGTPELRAVREECEQRARAAIGDQVYADLFRRASEERPGTSLARILAGEL
ncbi:NB-ARC domain-containing protein [Streptomyces decoyicus]|uniref:ATP-binding protein n=1 Tax=Streptomyces decoyicus TaxID=249567 RepID=UPI002E17E313|nr:NB-ARC domain-containing protein [Streptomyces decoyicus]WSV50602.1 NB-ARC domain-containing protein [Streptomyces decoyicus]